MQSQYKCIFFDLDHTLWDYETNSRETLLELYDHFNLSGIGIDDFNDFTAAFKEVNERLWDLYDRGLIDSEQIRKKRFNQVLSKFSISDEELSVRLSYEYLNNCPTRGNLIPHTQDTLEYLSERYVLTVVTNGFEEIQSIKLRSGNLHRYFQHMITSQKAGFKKPAREIFEYALNSNDIQAHQALMVGDNLITDIGGARNASIDTAFFNPDEKDHNQSVDYEIRSLLELRDLL